MANYTYSNDQLISFVTILLICVFVFTFARDVFVSEIDKNLQILCIMLGLIYLIVIGCTLYNAYVSNYYESDDSIEEITEPIDNSYRVIFWLLVIGFLFLFASTIINGGNILDSRFLQDYTFKDSWFFSYDTFGKGIQSTATYALVSFSAFVAVLLSMNLKAKDRE